MMRNGRLTSVLVCMLLTLTFLAAPVHACTTNGMGCREFPAVSFADRNDEFRFYEPRLYESPVYYSLYNRTSFDRQVQMGESQNSIPFVSDYIRLTLFDQWLTEETAAHPTTRQQTVKIKEKAAPTKSVTHYTVQTGDTLYRIAKFFGTTVDMLLLENHITDPTKLKIGQNLKIPSANRDIESFLDERNEAKQVFRATLTAYTAGFESTGKTPSHPAYGITASGAKVKENHTIAVDPKLVPLGTLVYIEGIGIRRAEDTGSAIKGAKIDVYIPDLKKARKFGVKKNVKVYVLDSQKNEVKIASAKP